MTAQKYFEHALSKTSEIGYVESTNSPLVFVKGLPGAKIKEKIYFESGQLGQVLYIGEETVCILLLSETVPNIGVKTVRTDEKLGINIDASVLGKNIDPLGKTIFGELFVQSQENYCEIDMPAQGISDRKNVKEPFLTGVSIVDLTIPLGRGQRQLIIGDKKTGKSSFAIQIMLKQAKSDVVCVFAGVGKKRNELLSVRATFDQYGLSDKLVIVGTSANDTRGLSYLTPYTAMRVAEYFRDQGKDVLIVIDDMSTHARVYREIALLAKKFPGKDSYPADIFYIHASFLERAGCFKNSTITCLPIVNTIEGDLSGYIQTNLMSMTDGHIFFDKQIFYSGQRPAINAFLSVTRVGRQTQNSLRWTINRELSSFLNLYEKTKNFVHFGAELNEGIRSTLSQGDKVMVLFNQDKLAIFDLGLQILLFAIIWGGFWKDKSTEDIKSLIAKVSQNFDQNAQFRTAVLELVNSADTFNSLLGNLMKDSAKYTEFIY